MVEGIAGEAGSVVAVTVRPKNDRATFVKVWQGATSKQDAADKLGIALISAEARASTLRGLGIPLKTFTRVNAVDGGDNLDILQLIAESTGQTIEEVIADRAALVAKNDARKVKAAAKVAAAEAKALAEKSAI